MERSSSHLHQQELELYTIPSYSSWFSWNNIHEVERFSLREFFDGSSLTRSPRIYKEYRDFIISRYRQEPSRKLTFTEVRKSLVGDISILLKVYTFLEKWGLINFNTTDSNKNDGGDVVCVEEERGSARVKVEEGAPHGVRVVAAPNLMKPIPPLPSVPVSVGAADGGGVVGEVGEGGFRWPPLASYSDVYGELMKEEEEEKGFVCGGCKEDIGGNGAAAAGYEYVKDRSFLLCEKCFKTGNYENKLADDFKLKDSIDKAAVWTEAEALLLLESVLKHGDDWDLVAKDVQTKSKLDCISKLIQLPFGDLLLGAARRKNRDLDVTDDIGNSKQSELASNELQEPAKAEEPSSEHKDSDQQNGDTEKEGPPVKKVKTEPISDVGNSLMNQVARISTMMGPHVTASAADAAITALCYENQCSRELFDDDYNYVDPKASPETSEPKRATEVDNAVEEERLDRSEDQEIAPVKSLIPLNLRTRAATATALGATAANAKLLADQEEREMGHLVATIIEAQLKKLRRKMKYFENLEQIMEKENAQLEEHEESLVTERLNVLQRVFSADISKTKDHMTTKLQSDVVQ